MPNLIIDDKVIQAPTGANVMEVALANNIPIPHLCYHPELSISGGCRLCLVEVEGRPDPVPSCGLKVSEGMVVRTQSEQLHEMRHDILDLFVSDHPLDCVTCDKAGACELQKYAYEYGITRTSFETRISRSLYQDDNPFFVRDHQYCILCSKCVRVCEEVVGASAIDFAGRGFEAHISTPFDGPMINSQCVFCGSCVQICPTSALMPASRRGKGREWELERVKTICGYCGVGCQIEYAKKDGKIIYAQGRPDGPANGEYLCSKGRSGWGYANHPDRLKQPMIRKDVAYQLGLTSEPWTLPEESPLNVHKFNVENSFVPVSWDTALSLVAERMADVVRENGPDSVMGLASARCTNEENYLFQKFLRVGVGTNNIDHCARL